MSDQNRGSTPAAGARKLTPWLLLGVAFIGVLAGSGVSFVVEAANPWNIVIIAATVAVVVLIAWAVLNLRH